MPFLQLYGCGVLACVISYVYSVACRAPRSPHTSGLAYFIHLHGGGHLLHVGTLGCIQCMR